jgi:hypothetical protein
MGDCGGVRRGRDPASPPPTVSNTDLRAALQEILRRARGIIAGIRLVGGPRAVALDPGTVSVLGVPAAAALLALCGSAMARPNVSGIYVASGGGTIETMQIIDEGDGEFVGSYSEYDVNHNKRYNGTIKGIVGDDGFVVASLSWAFFTISLTGTYQDGEFHLTSSFDDKHVDFMPYENKYP